MMIAHHRYQRIKTLKRMKKIILLSCAILLVANLLFGALISFYGWCNVAMSSAVILVTGMLLYLTDTIYLKEAFKVSLIVMFVIAGALEFVFSLIAPNRFTDNWWLILVIFLLAVEVITLIITNTISKKEWHGKNI